MNVLIKILSKFSNNNKLSFIQDLLPSSVEYIHIIMGNMGKMVLNVPMSGFENLHSQVTLVLDKILQLIN